MSESPLDVVNAYFACMRSHDPRVADLFHEDAVLLGLGTRRSGKATIAEFYRVSIEGGKPTPRPPKAVMVDGDRVAAEIVIDFPNGMQIHAIDLFHVEAGRIRSLTYFLADYPPEGD